MINFEDLIKRHEGFSKTLYRCTAGKLTIGYGRNIEDNGISQDEAELMLSNDIEEHDVELTKVFPDPMPDSCYAALLDMHFNLGHTKFMQFRKMISAVKEGDYEKAAEEMLDSAWAKQVPTRAEEDAVLMRGATDD